MQSVILDEIFNLQHRVSDQAIDYISDELDSFRCTISEVEDNDVAVTISFGRSLNGMSKVVGEIRIDRLRKQFEIVGRCEGTMLPACGSWDVIIEYLRQLTNPQ